MKKLLLILSIATLAISCKKDKLYNCLEGKWYESGNNTPSYIIDSKGHESINNYNIDSDGYVSVDGIKRLKFTCNGNELNVCSDVQFGCNQSSPGFLHSKYYKH